MEYPKTDDGTALPSARNRSAGHPTGLIALAAAAALVAACSKPAEPQMQAQIPVPHSGAMDASVHPELWPKGQWPLPRDPAIEARIQALLGRMSLEEKVGQLIQADIGSITPADIRDFPLGSILAGGNSAPGGKQFASAQEWLALADAYHAASASREGTAIPLLFGIDAVHGHNNVIGATLFPHNIGLGAAHDPELVRRIARATAIELRVTGAEWTFAPTLTVPRDDRWGRSYEGYSENPQVVASYASAVVEGLQGKARSDEFLSDQHVLSSAKHFLGDGGTHEGRDQGDTRIDEAGLRDIHGAGYPPAIAAGVNSVMASFSGWNGTKLHGHRGLLTEVLRGRMQFDGFVVGDWNGHGQVSGCSNEDCVASIEAGVDMLMAPDSWRGLFNNTLKAAREGGLSADRLNEAVSRILRVKLQLGLFDSPKPSERSLGGRFDLIGSAEHRSLAREAVRRSLVLLKNNGALLPLDPRGRLLVAGDGADNVGKQSGGWTLTWQGTGTTAADFPGAQSIWDGLRRQVEAAGGIAELSVDGSYSERPDAAVVVFGEDPYAEFQGDVDTLAYRPSDPRDPHLLKRLRDEGIPVVAVFLSGRPLWVNREINAAQAFVAAWLPGSEGGGVADMLLRDAKGEVQHDFSGRLSFSWPARPDQFSLNAGDADYAPQFAYGHGLSLGDSSPLPELAEDVALGQSGHRAGQWFARGSLAEGAQFVLSDDGGSAAAGDAPSLQSPSGAVQARGVDHQAQEDARRFDFSAAGSVAIELGSAVDIERETNGDVLLILSLRLEQAPTGPVSLGMGCGEACTGSIDATSALQALGAGWTRLGVPLKCLRAAGADVRRISRPLQLSSEAAFAISIARVELGTDFDQTLDCDR